MGNASGWSCEGKQYGETSCHSGCRWQDPEETTVVLGGVGLRETDEVRVPSSSSHLLRQLPFTTPSLVRQIPNDRPPIGEMDVLDERIAIGNVVQVPKSCSLIPQLPSLLQQMGGALRKGKPELEADDRRAEVVDLGTSEKKGPAAYPPNAGIPNERPTPPFDVVVTRSGMHWKILGVLVSPDDDARYLFVDDIWEPSLISEWNDAHADHLQVEYGDTIISVNGSTCNGEGMLAKIQAAVQGESIRLTIQKGIVSTRKEFLLNRLNEG